MQTDLSRFQDEDGEWLDPDLWPTVERVATCRTPGCPAEGQGHLVALQENVDGVLRAVCGRCGNPPELTVPTPEEAER